MRVVIKLLVLCLLGCAGISAQEKPIGKGEKTLVRSVSEEPDNVKAATPRKDHTEGLAKKAVEEEPIEKPALGIPTDRDEVVRLQIFLDQKRFGPGFIDGKPGMFTKLAIINYNASLGRKKGDLRVFEEYPKGVTQAYATAIIPKSVGDYVDSSLPRKRSLQAERKSMPYRSVTEFMAERYHTSEDLLIEINGAKVMRNAKARAAIKVPNIEPFKIEDLKVGKSHKHDETLSARHLVIDTGVKQIYIYQLMLPTAPSDQKASPDQEGEQAVKVTVAKPVLIASFPITPGKTRFIPKGFWNLKNSVELPEWRYDKKLLETGVRGKEYLTIPPGPNNPVGIIWNGLTKSGIGLHGTNNPKTIGRARSAGCIRLANWDAARIPLLVRPGAVVLVK